MSFGAQFLAGQKFAQGLIETYRDAQQRRELDEISKAQPVSADFLSDDASAKVQAAAADPTQHIGYDAGAKAYTATPKLGEDEMGPAQPKQIATAEPMTELLGKRTPGTMTPDQVSNAKFKAMADVVGKSDPIQGMRLQREVKQGERDDKRWEREERTAKEEEDFKTGQQAEFAQTIYGKRMGEYATQVQAYEQYQAKLKSGAAPETLGAPPPMPQRPAYSVAESLADSGRLLAFKASKGKADPAEILQYADRLQKVSDEGYGKALKLAQGGAPLEKVIEQFNQTGSMKLDPAAVVSDEMVKDADGVPSRVIKVRDANGNVQTINALSELDAIGQAENYFNRFDKDRTFKLNARKTEVAERQAATAERKIDLLLMGAGRSGGGGGGRGGAKDGGGPAVWDDKADAYLRERYTTKDPSTGEVRVDGSGLQFGKTLALAVSQNNGGDHTKGLGYAFQKDNELRAAATDKTGKYDAAKHEQLRQQYLMAISGQQATSPAPAATTGTQPNSGQRPARTSEGRGAIGNPMPSQILTTMGGILPKAGTYTPPPDSPAGKVQASREAARTATMKQEAERAKAVADAAAAAISSKDPSAAQAVQSMHGFGALPLEQKAEIRRIVFGR